MSKKKESQKVTKQTKGEAKPSSFPSLPSVRSSWTKPPEWAHIPGEPTRPPIVPSWARAFMCGEGQVPGLPLFGYQEEYIQCPHRFVAWLKSRQIGGSFTTALKHVLRVHKADQAGRAYRAVIFSAGKDVALENIRYVTTHARAIEAFENAEFVESGETYDEDPEKNIYAKFTVQFPGSVNKLVTSQITAIAANPYTAIGRSANIVADEVSRWRDARQVWDAIVPFVTVGDLTMDLCSTPLGVGNLWHDLITHADRYGLHVITTNIWDAIQDREIVMPLLPAGMVNQLRIDPIAIYKLCGDDNIWAQNYLCDFVETANTLLPLDLITACEAEGTLWKSLSEARSGTSSRLLFGGWDIARKRDLSVIWIMELLGDVLVTRWREELRGVPLPVQYDLAESLMKLPGMRRMDVDQTGMGLALAEFLARRFGSARIGGITFTGPARVEMSKRLKARFADRTIRIPIDPLLRDDLRLIKKEDTLSTERIVIDESGESHADRFWAIALAGYAAYEHSSSSGESPGIAPTTQAWSAESVMDLNPAADLADQMLRAA